MARLKQKNTRDLDKRLDALRTDLDQLQTDAKGLAGDAADVATGQARAAIRAAESVAERALRLAEETARGFGGDLEHWTNDNLDVARGKVREQPLAALLLSLGIGLLFGAIFLKS
ncbi:MAG TPA: hypothetical protein VG889_17710 [Rhizomicrobium sp.]|nr:hypothetical protein [Rhizomicrobium sp.]